MVQKAIDFATKVHEGQYRKGTDRPYIVHPMEVGKIVSTMTQDEEIISAAILHDTIEDCVIVDTIFPTSIGCTIYGLSVPFRY